MPSSFASMSSNPLDSIWGDKPPASDRMDSQSSSTTSSKKTGLWGLRLKQDSPSLMGLCDEQWGKNSLWDSTVDVPESGPFTPPQPVQPPQKPNDPPRNFSHFLKDKSRNNKGTPRVGGGSKKEANGKKAPAKTNAPSLDSFGLWNECSLDSFDGSMFSEKSETFACTIEDRGSKAIEICDDATPAVRELLSPKKPKQTNDPPPAFTKTEPRQRGAKIDKPSTPKFKNENKLDFASCKPDPRLNANSSTFVPREHKINPPSAQKWEPTDRYSSKIFTPAPPYHPPGAELFPSSPKIPLRHYCNVPPYHPPGYQPPPPPPPGPPNCMAPMTPVVAALARKATRYQRRYNRGGNMWGQPNWNPTPVNLSLPQNGFLPMPFANPVTSHNLGPDVLYAQAKEQCGLTSSKRRKRAGKRRRKRHGKNAGFLALATQGPKPEY